MILAVAEVVKNSKSVVRYKINQRQVVSLQKLAILYK